ncbi:MAG TPA: CHAT domain-containing tetratricopeptide repeat protein, partial [Bryobacteraceae bacterium]|nr:CHAT domain-containing tetratricopeptide repeat protein [Bryobacteraceae bacterium]
DAKLKIAFATYNLGRLNLSEGRFKEADLYLKRSLAVEESIHDQLEVGATLVAISDLEYKRGDMPSSREFAQRAVAAGEHTRQMEVQWTAYTALGRAQKALGHPAEAKQAFESAIALLEDLRTRVAGGARERAIFFASKTEPYQERMELAIEAGRIDEAFHYSERARARALLDTIDRHHEPLAKAMTADQRAEERRLRMVLTAASLEMQSAAAPDADLSRRKQDQARLNYQTFQTALYAAHPDLRVARAESPIIDVKAAQALLPSHNAALLEFTVTPRQTWLFVINAAGVRRFTLKISQAALKRRVEVFLAQLSNRDLRVDQAARDLYALLIEPANSALAGTSDWIVSPDGPLWELPFQALEPEQGHFLIERVSFSYAPSFTVLSAEMQAAARRKTSGDTLLAFGDPAGRSPLPDAARQVQAVAAIYPGSRSYTGMDATEERWKREAPPYRILHFAAHAVFDDRSPLYSHITLAEPAPGSSEDGLLEAWEIMQLDLNAQLSVLSACETARGGDVPGEGVIGLTWALFVAGSPSALVSQWKVDAKSSGDLMLEFHRQWRGGSNGIGKAKALQSAQLAMLRKPNSHPFDWAAFILVGDGR